MTQINMRNKPNLTESSIQNVCSQMNVALNEAAQILNVSPRSIQRYLRQQGTCFSQIGVHVHRQAAFKLLVQDRLTISEIKQMLRYSDPSNFCRAPRT